ncbi:MAG: D-amino acid aminotransferase [Candidatus Lernaella stagnicola]|nr:D-amino acid aminotransferase [Candidatus Lernaella stagnicola]
MPEIASVNGEITAIEKAFVSINDRGFVFGDGVYEVIVSYRNKLFLFDEHIERLRRSLRYVRMDYVDVEDIIAQIERAFDAADMPRAKVYVQVTRGAARRNHVFPDPPVKPNVIVTVSEFPPVDEKLFEDGIACLTRADIRWGRVDIKTINLLPNCLAKQEALDNGCLEAILIGEDGEVREATAANVFIVRKEKVITHPDNERILCGITRNAVLALCHKAGYQVEERPAPLEEMMLADEVFLSGTTAEVMPVVRVDDQPIGKAKPGPVAARLRQLFQAWINTSS